MNYWSPKDRGKDGSKKPPNQEMVQVANRFDSSSPLWKTAVPTANRKVVGASYSHTDALKFDTLNIGRHSRPRTPPSINKSRDSSLVRINSRDSPSRNTNLPLSNLKHASLDDNEEEYVTEYMNNVKFEDDEDEFGLPSIASMRRKGKKMNPQKVSDLGGLFSKSVNGLTSPLVSSNISLHSTGDLAEERGIPSYPTPKKIEGKTLRPQYKEILRDPANSLHLIDHISLPINTLHKDQEAHAARLNKINKFKRILQATTVSISDLRSSAWSGIPSEVRSMTWQLLLGYLPCSSERRVATLERKRKEYLDAVRQAFERGTESTTVSGTGTGTGTGTAANLGVNRGRGKSRGLDEAIWHQISIDVPRTNPHLELYSYEATQRSLERILYVWAIRHPASGYVQGINDLVTPFWQVFLGAYISNPAVETGMDPGQLPKSVLDAVEADCFWCLTKLLEGIQDNYVSSQPGIQRQVTGLKELTARIDAGLVQHLEQEGVEFIQFSFRWMNCLLMREISVANTIRMWDTYLSEDQGFSEFHLYVCAAFLVKWSDQLLQKDFQEVMMFLQALPTRDWTEKDIELLLSEAFMWHSLFRGSSAHLKGNKLSDNKSRLQNKEGGMLG